MLDEPPHSVPEIAPKRDQNHSVPGSEAQFGRYSVLKLRPNLSSIVNREFLIDHVTERLDANLDRSTHVDIVHAERWVHVDLYP